MARIYGGSFHRVTKFDLCCLGLTRPSVSCPHFVNVVLYAMLLIPTKVQYNMLPKCYI
jgi:hypothetical protein